MGVVKREGLDVHEALVKHIDFPLILQQVPFSPGDRHFADDFAKRVTRKHVLMLYARDYHAVNFAIQRGTGVLGVAAANVNDFGNKVPFLYSLAKGDFISNNSCYGGANHMCSA